MRVAVVLVVLSGCYFYAKDTQTRRPVGMELVLVPIHKRSPVIEARAFDATIRLFASTPRNCRRDETTKIEVTHGKQLALGTVADDGYSLLCGILLAPITLPISALIAAGELGAHDDYVTHEAKVAANGVQPCPDIHAWTFTLVLPSGATKLLDSKPDGTVELVIPPEEPDHGTVVVAIPGATINVGYFKTHAACDAHRAVVFQQALGDPSRLAGVPRCETLTTGGDREIESGWTQAVAALAAATHGDCTTVQASEWGVRHRLPQWFGPLFAVPAVAACVEKMSTCRGRRAEAMRIAQTIQDPNQRGEALRRIPACP